MLNESSGITNIYPLLIFVRTVDDKFSTRLEFLDLVPLPINAKNSHIYVYTPVSVKFSGFSKCFS